MKIRWKHGRKVGRIKRLDKEIIRMLKIGAKFTLTPAYRVYYKNGKQTKTKLKHVSLRLQK